MKYIDRPEALTEACRVIERSPWAALDTEADSLHHYLEKLCLVQVSVEGEDFVIDPLAGLDLGPLLKDLNDKKLILHGADFDIRILRRYYPFEPREVFDTMIAAQLLGYDKQGLADLARKICGVHLSKKSQKADWSRRPLTPELLEYAYLDTHHLKTIRDALEKELSEKGRSAWHGQNCRRVVESALKEREKETDPDTVWRVRGSHKLEPRGQAVLRELWHWRETEARRRDRPSFKILHTATLLQIAEHAQKNEFRDVATIGGAPRPVRRELRDLLNGLVEKGRRAELPAPQKPPAGKKGKRLDVRGKKRFTDLKAVREKAAAELQIQPSLLVTNASLETLALESPETREEVRVLGRLLPWQAEILADRVLSITARPPAP